MDEDEAAAMPGGFKRLTPGQAVRLRGAYVIRCSEVVRDPGSGKVLRLHCVHDDSTLGKKPVGYKAAGVIHWVSAEHGVPVTLRHFRNLFCKASALEITQKEHAEIQLCDDAKVEALAEVPDRGTTDADLLLQNLDQGSLMEFAGVAEPSVLEAVRSGSGSTSELARRCWFQFEREGYYVLDERLDADGRLRSDDDAEGGVLVFNMVVGLRQSKSSRKGHAQASKVANAQKGRKNRKGRRTEKQAPASAKSRNTEVLKH